jgi:RNA polymerase sigma-70 factor, ECF subfamily
MAAKKLAEKVSPDPDERLLIEAAQADPARFAELYEMHFERIYAFISRRVGDRDQAEDLTAEVFNRALANLGTYQWRGAPFAAWLYRIAAHVVADRARQEAREVLAADPPEGAVIPDMEAVERRANLFRLVNRLPRDQRSVIFDRFVEQRSVHDIAKKLGKTEGAVKQLQFRALHSLRARLEGRHA